jgi:hypothetical protein
MRDSMERFQDIRKTLWEAEQWHRSQVKRKKLRQAQQERKENHPASAA